MTSRGPWHPERPLGLGRALAKAGHGTRQATDAIVREGRVTVNGDVVRDPARCVDVRDVIELDGQPLEAVRLRYFAFNKPLRVAARPGDPDGRRLVDDFLPRDVPGLRAAGRLDALTAGLLFVSNDSAWNALAAPARGAEREFRVEVTGEMTDLELGLIASGMHLHRLGFVRPRSVKLVRRESTRTEVSITIGHGRNRQIRRLFDSLRHEVIVLRRVRIGPVELGELMPGQLRELTTAEVEAIRRLSRMDRGRRADGER
ncbi:MAG: pseudouridine synthase [Candidatus Krumholzibacteriia bacterium]